MKHDLEPVLELADPRERISAYHDMPYALFRYDPDEEFDLRALGDLFDTHRGRFTELTRLTLPTSSCPSLPATALSIYIRCCLIRST